jgi:5'-methylthioadenosine phosphorylase
VHDTPPHRINYRANIKALHQLGVTRILATNAVGSISRVMPPLSLVVLDDFIDFSSGRPFTFYDGGDSGLAHTELNHPYCPTLRQQLLDTADSMGVPLIPNGVYVCANGPRFETPAEIRMYGMLGGDVVGMTGVPEATLARELGMHYAAVAYSINWAAGIEEVIEIVEEGREELLTQLRQIFVNVLLTPAAEMPCTCADSVWMMQPPKGA